MDAKTFRVILERVEDAGRGLASFASTAHDKPGRPTDRERKLSQTDEPLPQNYSWPGILQRGRWAGNAFSRAISDALAALPELSKDALDDRSLPAPARWSGRMLRTLLVLESAGEPDSWYGDSWRHTSEWEHELSSLIEYQRELKAVELSETQPKKKSGPPAASSAGTSGRKTRVSASIRHDLIVSILEQHHVVGENGQVRNCTPLKHSEIFQRLNKQVSAGGITAWMKKHFGETGHLGYEAACNSGRFGIKFLAIKNEYYRRNRDEGDDGSDE